MQSDKPCMNTTPSLTELAHLHSEAYDAVANEYNERVGALRSVTVGILDAFQPYLPPSPRVLDVGCGAGLAVRLMAARDWDATGIELSPRMAAVARKRNPQSQILLGDVLTMMPPERLFDGVLALAFIHLFPRESIQEVLASLRGLLTPEGVLYTGTTDERVFSEGFEVKEDYGVKVRRFRSHWPVKELVEEIESAGFTVSPPALHVDAFGKRWLDMVANKSK